MPVNVYLLPRDQFILSHNQLLKHLSSFFIALFTIQAPAPEYELETLTGKSDWAMGGQQGSPPPEYATIMVTKEEAQPPDYFDDIVNKVVI